MVKVSNQFIDRSIWNSFWRFYKQGSRFSFFLNTGEKVGSFHYLLLSYANILYIYWSNTKLNSFNLYNLCSRSYSFLNVWKTSTMSLSPLECDWLCLSQGMIAFWMVSDPHVLCSHLISLFIFLKWKTVTKMML